MMEKREGYKKTEIGWLPEEWVLSPLEEISDISMGQSPSSEAYNQENIGMPLIQGNADIRQRLSKPRVWTSQITKTCDVDDILMTVRAPVGAIANAVHNACIGRGVCSIKPMNADRGYLYQFLLSLEPKWGQIEQGSTFTAVNGKDVKAINITCPPLPEQKKIASILTTVDDKISSIDQQIQQTEQLKKGLMEKLLTEGIGHTEFKDTKIGRIPKGWKVVDLGDLVETTQLGLNIKASPSNQGIPMLKMGNLTIGGFNFSKIEKIDDDSIDAYKDFVLKEGDFLFNTRNTPELVGKSAAWKNNRLMLFNNNILRIIFTKDADSFYLSYYFSSTLGWQKLKRISKNTTSVGAIYTKDLMKIKIGRPPIEEQKKIATILSTVDDKIEVLNQKKTQYQTLKKGLSQQLLTGQIRVKI